MHTQTLIERADYYRSTIERFMQHVQSGEARIHVPDNVDLRRPSTEMPYHLTPELFLQIGGATAFSCPANCFNVAADEIALIPRSVPHGEVAIDGAKAPFRVLVFCFAGIRITFITSRCDGDRPQADLLDTLEAPEVSQAVHYLDDAAAASLAQNHSTREIRLRSLLVASLSVIYELLTPDRLMGKPEPGRDVKVVRCKNLIEALLPNPALSVDLLARQIGCSSDHLSRCFREETGVPVLRYVREERVARAQELLQDPKLNVSEIAWACGFTSLNYFVRTFRQATGQPPRQFRKALSAEDARAVQPEAAVHTAIRR